jgi:homoserine kinase type II
MAMPDPRPVLAEFLPPDAVHSLSRLDNAGGWSGSLLWRVVAECGTFCLRLWPAEMTCHRLSFIHQVLTHIAAQGIDFVPVPQHCGRGTETIVEMPRFRFWELTPWLPGTADYHAHPTRARLASALEALARFHAAGATFPAAERATGIAQTVTERLEQVRQLLNGDLERIASTVQSGLDADLDLRARQLLPLARGHLPQLAGPLAAACRPAQALLPAIRDVHHDHVLFAGEAVTGLVDFGALRIDTPLADVARLVGSLAGDDESAREFALAAYARFYRLDEGDRRLIDLLDFSGQVLGALNWLRWLYLERRDMGPLPPIVKRVDAILARLVAVHRDSLPSLRRDNLRWGN